MSFLEELKWRGMLHDSMPGVEKLLEQPGTKGYIGFDPTADSLGVGNLVQVMTMVHFQRAGHKPIALVGGATGMVGDPSFKSDERQLLDFNTLQHNLSGQLAQLEKFLEFGGPNGAQIVNNYDWFKDFGFLDFIRDVGKHITVNYMLAKDSVKSRQETGISFTEFSYQLIQGYDFYHLWKNHGVQLQMGGSDQWGNITTGTELIRRMGGGEAYALTTPLIKKADGTKFGKTESGNVWLDPKRTSPYQFYQFWLNAADADVAQYVRIFSTASREEIEALEATHAQAPHQRALQKFLAEEITARVHSADALRRAQDASEILFGTATADAVRGLDEATLLDVFKDVPQFTVSRDTLAGGLPVVELLAGHTRFAASKGEARTLLQGGGISVNKIKAESDSVYSSGDLLNDRYLLLQRGKKTYALVTFG